MTNHEGTIHPIYDVSGYFEPDELARFTDTVRDIVYGSDCSLIEALSLLVDLAEGDETAAAKNGIITYPSDLANIRRGLSGANTENQK